MFDWGHLFRATVDQLGPEKAGSGIGGQFRSVGDFFGLSEWLFRSVQITLMPSYAYSQGYLSPGQSVSVKCEAIISSLFNRKYSGQESLFIPSTHFLAVARLPYFSRPDLGQNMKYT